MSFSTTARRIQASLGKGWFLPVWSYTSIISNNDEEASVFHTREKRNFKTLAKQQLHQTKRQIFTSALIILLIATSFGFGVLSAFQYRDRIEQISSYSHVPSSPLFLSSTLPRPKTPVPEFSTIRQPVLPKPEFTVPPEEEMVANTWRASLPNAMFIYIDDPEMYNLDPGMPTDQNGTERKAYGVTWTHEYHCLMMIREEFWSLVRGTSELTHQYGDEDTLEPDAQRNLWHLQHCMDYIRQLTLCQADMTIEVAAKYPATNGKKYHIDGLGTEHVCKNKDEVYEWMDAHSPAKYVGQPD